MSGFFARMPSFRRSKRQESNKETKQESTKAPTDSTKRLYRSLSYAGTTNIMVRPHKQSSTDCVSHQINHDGKGSSSTDYEDYGPVLDQRHFKRMGSCRMRVVSSDNSPVRVRPLSTGSTTTSKGSIRPQRSSLTTALHSANGIILPPAINKQPSQPVRDVQRQSRSKSMPRSLRVVSGDDRDDELRTDDGGMDECSVSGGSGSRNMDSVSRRHVMRIVACK